VYGHEILLGNRALLEGYGMTLNGLGERAAALSRGGATPNRARRTGGAVMGSAPRTAGERAASTSTSGGGTVMGSAPGG